MRCECCGEEHRDIRWLAGWLKAVGQMLSHSTLGNISDKSAAVIAETQAEYSAAYSCLYDETIGGGE